MLSYAFIYMLTRPTAYFQLCRISSNTYANYQLDVKGKSIEEWTETSQTRPAAGSSLPRMVVVVLWLAEQSTKTGQVRYFTVLHKYQVYNRLYNQQKN